MCTTPRQRMLAPEESGTDGLSSGYYKHQVHLEVAAGVAHRLSGLI